MILPANVLTQPEPDLVPVRRHRRIELCGIPNFKTNKGFYILQHFCVLFQCVEKDEGILCVTDHVLASSAIASTRFTLTSGLIYMLVILAFEV